MTSAILNHPSSPSTRLRIIRGEDRIPVDHPVMLIFGQPGIGKSSLGYSAGDVLLLDCDQGAHRAVNRRDTLAISSWADIEALLDTPHALANYTKLAIDTVGRAIDLLTLDIIHESPKYARDGNLTQQGWGVLKSRFRTFLARVRAMEKDLLLIAHGREDKDGDVTQVRPDIQGGSYGEVLKSADFVGYLAMVGKHRVLDFSPSDRWVGKNPAGWRPLQVPPIAKATRMLAELFDEGRQALGDISEDAAKVLQQVQSWKGAIPGYATVEDVNRAFQTLTTSSPMVQAQVKPLLHDRAKALGLIADVATKTYRAPQPVAPPMPPPVTTAIAAEVIW